MIRYRFFATVASLSLVDLAITGIFIAVSGRLSVLGHDLLANLAFFGVFNLAGAYWLFRPIQNFLSHGDNLPDAITRIRALPRLTSAWAILSTTGYCVTAFSLGVFVPDSLELVMVDEVTMAAGLAWFAIVYAIYYGFYTYFVVNDFTNGLKHGLFARGLTIPPDGARLIHKLILVFLVTAFVPSLLIAFDLTLFREIRAAQGLSVEQTIFLDLLASAFLVAVSLVFVTRSLSRPVTALTTAMRTLGEGRHDVLAPVMSSDELGALAQRFNEMLEGLRDREFIRETFGRYVPEEVVTQLLERRGLLEPQLQIATILFVDIENFTAIAESHAPETVLRMLNEFFSTAIEPINQAGGVVNQFQGDAILATFNIPAADPDHADKAVGAAVEMQRAIAGKTFAGIPLRARIGIHTGEVIAGAVGSNDRSSYTVHGDAVNLASRLEGLNKELGTEVLVSGATVRRLRHTQSLKPAGSFALRGKSETIEVYEIQT